MDGGANSDSHAAAAGTLRRAIAVPNWGPYGEPRAAARLARKAEEAGWDGYFTWDAFIVRRDPPPVYSPWLILSAVALATTSVRIGTCVAIPARYKPHLLAMTLANLDRMSDGRLILGVGIGDGAASFEAFGEAGDARVRAEKLDEALEIMVRLWSGEELTYRGRHFSVHGYVLSPLPVQQPRIPIWVGGDSPAAIRRAARWDGWIGPDNDPLSKTAADLVEVRRQLVVAGAAETRFDIAWAGAGHAGGTSAVAEAGASWSLDVAIGAAEAVWARVAAGPSG